MKKLLIAAVLLLLCGCGTSASSESQAGAGEKEIDTGYGITLILPDDISEKEFENCDFSYGNDTFNVLGVSESREYLACIGEDPDMNIQEYAASLYENMDITQIDEKRASAEDIHDGYYEYEVVIEGEDRFWTVGFIQENFDDNTKALFKTYGTEKTAVNNEQPPERKTFNCDHVLIDLPRQFEYSKEDYYETLECGYVTVIVYDFSSSSDFAQLSASADTDALAFAQAVQSYMQEQGEIVKVDDSKAYYTFETDSYYVTEYVYDYGSGFANVEFACPLLLKDTVQRFFPEWASTLRPAE